MPDLDVRTFAATYVCTILALILIFVRLGLRHHRREVIHVDDVWMGVSLIPLIIRWGVIHVVLVYGTNNFDRKHYPIEDMSDAEIRWRIAGSKMIIATRIFYAGFIWCMKVCILGFYERLTARSKPTNIILSGCIGQMTPDPGHCVQAVAQLVTMGSLNILTDAALILIPLPLVFKSRLPVMRKIQLFLLFGVGMFVVCVTIIRMPLIIGDHSIQQARTLWASIECLVACIVANAPVLNSFLRRKSRKPLCEEHNHSANSRRRRMPVTGQDSVGSLTRNGGNDGLDSVIETRTEVIQKIDIDPLESGNRSKVTRSPWRGDFLGTHIWTKEDRHGFPTWPPAVARGGKA
ncbi:hypothetical protein L873DRAFT_1721185 [Choiromyces venosus 120613-1]|uniref:Rhodopsin domain-containing protein n=1 Tax=Choiromyces venosus 120613-1 TaxID=1336337 RepID=A0A3N4ITS7_9PEZI|nr:hypothetical protein L873DRAFT_1721185 [Choiromyces venosus 120613-1]